MGQVWVYLIMLLPKEPERSKNTSQQAAGWAAALSRPPRGETKSKNAWPPASKHTASNHRIAQDDGWSLAAGVYALYVRTLGILQNVFFFKVQ